MVREATVKMAKLLDAGKGRSSKDARHILSERSRWSIALSSAEIR